MKIGFIGLGTMGGRMASSLRAAGHEMYVNDIRPEAVAPHVAAGAVAKPTARDVGDRRRCGLHIAAGTQPNSPT